MATEGIINLDTMPDHSDPSQTDVVEPTKYLCIGHYQVFGGRGVVRTTLIPLPTD